MITNEDITILALQGKHFELRNVYDVNVDSCYYSDYPDFADAFVAEASWIIDETQLDSDELDWLNDNCPDLVYALALDQLF